MFHLQSIKVVGKHRVLKKGTDFQYTCQAVGVGMGSRLHIEKKVGLIPSLYDPGRPPRFRLGVETRGSHFFSKRPSAPLLPALGQGQDIWEGQGTISHASVLAFCRQFQEVLDVFH